MSEDRVTFRRQVSDGNYGSETIEVTVEVLRGEGIGQALAAAREIVQLELRHSPNPAVRHAMERELS